SPLMKLRDAVTFTGLIFLVVTQTIVFVRLESIERRFSGKTGYEALDRSLASMQRTVDALSSGQPGSKSPSVSLAGSATPRLPDRLSDTVKDKKELEAGVQEGKNEVTGEASEEEGDSEELVSQPIDPTHPLARRKQFLEDLRARLRQVDANSDNKVSIK